jgi:hypothetical protein
MDCCVSMSIETKKCGLMTNFGDNYFYTCVQRILDLCHKKLQMQTGDLSIWLYY